MMLGMIGAIAGDIIGSIYEFDPIKTKDFPLFLERSFFTDDSVLSCAVAEAIMTGRPYRDTILELGRRYPDLSYGGSFRIWLASDNPQPYNSWGNGSAMRVSPIGFAFDTEEDVLREARKSAEITHNHPEGIKGAQATALAILLARKGADKDEIRRRIGEQFEYELNRTVDEVRPNYYFNESCQGTVPEAIIAFLDSESYEDAIRNTVSLGGDADTLGAISGGIAEAFYGAVPDSVRSEAKSRLPADLNDIVDRFYETNLHNQKSKRG